MNLSALTPLFVQVILTFVLGLGMMYNRIQARKGGLLTGDISLRQPNWPQRPTQWANAYANSFELPVLFYVLVILALITRQADNVFVLMAWAFVIMRIIQAAIHVTSNVVRWRSLFFRIGFGILAVMWGVFMLSILRAPV